MPYLKTLGCLAILAGVTLPAPADPATRPTTIPTAVQKAFDALASDESARRMAAQDELLAMGNDAVAPLQRLVEQSRDLEQRTNAQAVIARIVEQVSIGPTMISLKLDNATPQQIVAELARQSGMRLLYSGDNTGRASVQLQNVPFWEAVRHLNKTADLDLSNRGNGQIGFMLNPNKTGQLRGPASIDGPLMVIAQSANLGSNVSFQQNAQANRYMNLQFACFAEPKLIIASRPYTVRLTEVTDDTGKSLLPAGQGFDGGYYGGGETGWMWNLSAPIAMPEPAATKITRLRGQIRLMVASKVDLLEIPDVLEAKNVSRSSGGTVITLKDIKQEGDQVHVNLSLQSPNGRDGTQHNLLQSLRLLDAQGNAFTHVTVNYQGGQWNRQDLRVTFNRRGENDDGTNTQRGAPAKLAWPVPTELKSLECEFEFKDLKLPK